MNNNQTVEKLRHMRINAMADLHLQHVKNNQLGTLTADEYLALLTDHEWEERQNKKINRLIKHAGFRQKATLADIDYSATRSEEHTSELQSRPHLVCRLLLEK